MEKVEIVLQERNRELDSDERVEQLGEGFREHGLRLPQLGHSAGVLGSEIGIPDLPELKDLSTREWDVVLGLLQGYRISAVARKLGIRPNTVRNHLKAIFQKLGVRSQSELLVKLRPIERGSELA